MWPPEGVLLPVARSVIACMSGYGTEEAPMARVVFRVASVVSLVFCLTAICLWGRSYWRCDVYNWTRDIGSQRVAEFSVESAKGQCLAARVIIDIQTYRLIKHNPGYTSGSANVSMDPHSAVDWLRSTQLDERSVIVDVSFAGFDVFVTRENTRVWAVVLPYWFLVLVAAILPAVFVWRRHSSRRRAALLRPYSSEEAGRGSGQTPQTPEGSSV